jgi:glycopeptide antibiotics resistance protein
MMRLALAAWLCVWAAIALPWSSFQPTPSFQRVELIPFAIGTTRTQVLNFLAFVPLGVIGARLGWQPKKLLLFTAVLSAATELLQLFSATRYPQTTDFILNTAGALAGMTLHTYASLKLSASSNHATRL